MMKIYDIDFKILNNENIQYLNKIFEQDFNNDSDNFYHYLLESDQIQLNLYNILQANDESLEILNIIEQASDINYNISFYYSYDNIHTVLLDIEQLNINKHDYLKEIFNFPDYYGKNLDALYDCLSELDTTQILIINYDNIEQFSLNVIKILDEVNEEYENLEIIYLEDNQNNWDY